MKKKVELNLELLTATQRRIIEHLQKNGRIDEDEIKELCIATTLQNYRLDSNVANVHIKDLRRRLPKGFVINRIRGDAMVPGYWKLETV